MCLEVVAGANNKIKIFKTTGADQASYATASVPLSGVGGFTGGDWIWFQVSPNESRSFAAVGKKGG